jgi:hypothetical protein
MALLLTNNPKTQPAIDSEINEEEMLPACRPAPPLLPPPGMRGAIVAGQGAAWVNVKS